MLIHEHKRAIAAANCSARPLRDGHRVVARITGLEVVAIAARVLIRRAFAAVPFQENTG